MTDRRRKAIETALRRRAGATPGHAAKVSDHMLAQADLVTDCRACGARLRGTLDEIRAHACEAAE